MTEPAAENTTARLIDRLLRITSPAERRVAEFFVQAGAKAAPMSAQEIAAVVGTSDATVVRTARSLGFDSLRDLRRSLTDEEDDTDLFSRLEATIGAVGVAHDVLRDGVDRHLRALDTMVRRVTPEQFDAAVEILGSVRNTWWCGTGPSAHLAAYAAFLSRRLGRGSGTLTHSGTDHADELLAIGPDDAAVILAYGRVHPHVRVLLRRAGEVGARTVLITDTLGTRLPGAVDVQLSAGRGTPGLFASHAATMVLLESLVLAVAATDAGRSESAVATLNDLRRQIAGKRLDVDPD